MKPPRLPLLYISSSRRPLQIKILSSLHSRIHFELRSLRPFSTHHSQTSKWNSTTNVIITNPTLLIMESCNSMSQLKQIQAHMTRTGLIFHLFPLSRVLSFCALANTGDIDHANSLFAQISEPNVYMWNTMIRGFYKAQKPAMGLSVFRRMVRKGVEMDNRSFVFALKACEALSRNDSGESVHCSIWKFGFVFDLIVRNGLIHFYGVHGCLCSARKVFDESRVRDVVSWTAMIDGYSKKNIADEALNLFDLMLLTETEPNDITMITVFSACSQKGNLGLGKSIHEYIKNKNMGFTLNLTNSMLDMYAKCGCLIMAKEIFDNMETKDVYSWTSMINGYAKNGELDLARKCFDIMPRRNVVSWNAMISGYSQNSQPNKALELFDKMIRQGLVPMEATLVSALSACSQSDSLDFGTWIHRQYIEHNQIQKSVILSNALIDMYSKCGNVDLAAKIFNEMEKRDVVSWNSMIVGYASHGNSQNALLLFEKMEKMGFKPDDITFVGVLSACSHSGLLSKGFEHFKNMKKVYGLDPKIEHYACMIDLLGRIGLVQEAYEWIREMPMEADVASWGALLNACVIHKNVELGKIAADKLMILDPKDSGIYAVFASLCADKKEWEDVRSVRRLMREKGIRKSPGVSSIEVEGEFHEFFVADECHPQYEEIYRVLNDIFRVSKLED